VQVSACPVSTLSGAHSALQTPRWATIKEAHGWVAYGFTIERGGRVTDLLVLVRPIIARYTLAYIPFAPAGIEGGELAQLASKLRALLPRSVFVLRFDLPFGAVGAFDHHLLIPCHSSIQPEATIRMDLRAGYAAVRSGYHDRANRALKKIATTPLSIGEYAGEQALFDDFFALYRHTAEREGFLGRSRAYLATIVGDGSDPWVRLLYATLDGTLVAAIIVLFSQAEALYLFGASRRLEGISPSYALQDRAIEMACARGCLIYDLHGVGGPEGRGSHLSSLELFKRSFGGERVERAPTLDVPYRRRAWLLFRGAERIRIFAVRIRRALRRVP